MYHRSPESEEDTCNLYQLNVTLHNTLKGEPRPKDSQTFFFYYFILGFMQ